MADHLNVVFEVYDNAAAKFKLVHSSVDYVSAMVAYEKLEHGMIQQVSRKLLYSK